jgi:superfamily II DNA or RNA helicase
MLVSDAIKKKLLSLAPESEEDLCLDKWTEAARVTVTERPKLRDIQLQARQKWTAAGKRGILQMATGTGKTIAALACVSQEFEANSSLLCVISAPYDHLVKQWQREIGRFGLKCGVIVADSSVHGWKDTVTDSLIELKHEQIEQLIVLTTPNTLSSSDFMAIIEKSPTKKLLIVDEVHGIGAPQRQLGLLEDYELRLGLSATPRRWMDEQGTQVIFDYFGGTVYSFELKEAIETINPDTGETYLVPYYYYPKFVDLTSDEIEKYRKSSEKIAKLAQMARQDPELYKRLEMEMIRRQEILNNADNKYELLANLVDELRGLPYCLAYVSPEQIDRVMQILDSKDLRPHRFTMDEGTISRKEFGGLSEREEILKRFEQGAINPLVAIRCLDEGVDIKPARIGILMCSSGNEVQFIQRRGRLLRRSEGKSDAIIYDLIPVFRHSKTGVEKSKNDPGGYLASHEYRRFKEFAGIAKNSASCMREITRLELGII